MSELRLAAEARIGTDLFKREMIPARVGQLLPPKGRSNVRDVVIAPESAEAGLTEPERRESAKAFFAGMGALDVLVPGVGHPHAHRTETLDYIVVLAGELALLLATAVALALCRRKGGDLRTEPAALVAE